MAHLWVEVYFPNVGWVTFDPSPPADSSATFGQGRFAKAFSYLMLKAKMRWYRDVVAYDRGLQTTTLRKAGRGLGTMVSRLFTARKETTTEEGFDLPRVTGRILLGALLGGSLLAAVLKTPRLLRRQTYVLTADQTRAVRLYRRLLRRLREAGLDCRGKTAEEIEAELDVRDVTGLPTAREVLAIYNEVRFGGRSLQPQRYADLRKRLRECGASRSA